MPDNKVQFNFLHKSFTLSNRSKLKKFIESLIKKEGRTLGSLSYIFCSNKYLRGINKSFLKHDYNTDIITFNLSGSSKIEGEVYISIDEVRINAGIYDKSFSNELHRVILHGALHLCGYKDKKPSEIKKMRAAEDYYLDKYFK